MGFFFGFYLARFAIKWFILISFYMLAAGLVIAGLLVTLGAIAAFLIGDFLIQLIRCCFAKRGTVQWSWLGLPLVHLSYFSSKRVKPTASAIVAGAKTKVKSAPGPRDWSPADPDSRN